MHTFRSKTFPTFSIILKRQGVAEDFPQRSSLYELSHNAISPVDLISSQSGELVQRFYYSIFSLLMSIS